MFGSFDGAYDGDLFMGVFTRVLRSMISISWADGVSRIVSGYHRLG